MDKFGRVAIGFSEPLKEPSFSQLKRLRRRQLAKAVDVPFSEDFSKEVTDASRLDQILKLTNSVRLEMVPGASKDVDMR